MGLARRWGGVVAVAAAVALGAALYSGTGDGEKGPEPAPAALVDLAAREPAEPEEPGLVIHGFVQARQLDPAHWHVRALPLRYDDSATIPTAAIDSRGRFELTQLEDVDYRVELVREGEPPIVLASSDHVRPGGDELVLELDPLALASLRDLRDDSEPGRE